jgi:hypothetical protein
MTQNGYSLEPFEVDRPEDIPVEAFREKMTRDTFACIRGVVRPAEVKDAISRLSERFDRANDHPGTGQAADAVRSNFQKLNVGGESLARANDDARLFRAFYNPIWEEDIYGFRDAFVRMAKVRNVLAGNPIDFALDNIEDNGLWTASRIHQYPAGGGFFRGHTDYVVSDIADETGTRFYQLLLLMSEKGPGKDFEVGGAFVDLEDERIYLEDHFQPGDLMVYDGRSRHGVEDIDPHLPLDLDRINGRLAAFVTLFKVMH